MKPGMASVSSQACQFEIQITYYGDNRIPQVFELDQLHIGKNSEFLAMDIQGTSRGQKSAGPFEVPVEVVRVRHPSIDSTSESFLLIGPQFSAVGRITTESVLWEELLPTFHKTMC